jgi:hypothetical protein
MFPRSNASKKPIKLGVSPNKPTDMNAFIENELKLYQSMKRRNHNPAGLNSKNLNLNINLTENKTNPISSNNPPITVNNNMVESRTNLKNTMSSKGFNPSQKAIEDNMRTSQTKFEGFSNATKFTDSNTNNSSIIDKNESRRARRPPSSSSNKGEPFIIKFPQEQIQNKKTKDILKSLNKPKDNDYNFRNNNIIENISGLKASNERKDTGNKKSYIESYNKIADEPKNIFGDEEIEEDYGDFENVDNEKEKKNENKNDWEDMFGENANFNDVDEEKVLQPQKINRDKSKREQIIERLNDIKNIVLLSEEYIEIASIEKNGDKFGGRDMTFNSGDNHGKQDIAINTDEIVYKSKATATDENLDFNSNNEDNQQNDEENKNKDAHFPISSYNHNEIEKKSKIIISSYQPLSYDAYNVFVKTAPAIEKMLLNNINKYILQKKEHKKIEESTGMHKLSIEFNFPNDLLSYIFSNSKNVKIHIDKFLFFDTKPYLVAFSLSLKTKESSTISSFFEDNFGNLNSVYLIMLFDIFTNKIIKILFSESKVNDMAVIGDGENLLISARIDGGVDVFDIAVKGEENSEGDDKYFMGFENNAENNISLGRCDINQKSTPVNNNPKFKLILPIISSYDFIKMHYTNENITFNSQVKKMVKAVNKNNENSTNIDKLYELFIFDQTGYLISFQLNDSDTGSSTRLEYIFNDPYINSDLNPLIKRCFNTLPDDGTNCKENVLTEIYDIKYYKENILYILCNFGLCKFTIEGKDTFLCDMVYSSLSENNLNSMTCFDISDLGEIVCGFNDNSVKIINAENKEFIYSSFVDNLDESTLINNIIWSKAICKNSKNKLIRRTLLANFFIFTSKNEFVIYDLNQKNIEGIRKVKKFKDFGKALKLSKKNSLIEMSDCLYTDYSNFIAMSECNKINEAKFSITKLSLRKQFYEEASIVKVNKKIVGKLLGLLNN